MDDPLPDPFTPGLLGRLPRPPKKAILFKASRVGDFLHTYPAFKSLRLALPHTELTLVTLPLLKELAELCPYIDRVVAFPGFPGIAEQFFEPKKTLEFLLNHQREGYGLGIQLQGSGTYANPFLLMIGAERNAGFVGADLFASRLDAALPLPQKGTEAERMLQLTRFLGAPNVEPRLEFFLRQDDRQKAKNWLEPHDSPWVGLHTSSRSKNRRWPLKRFVSLGKTLQESLGATLVLFGEDEDRKALDRAFQNLKHPPLNLAGQTSLPLLGALIQRLTLLITNDSGPAHIAYALGTPCVTIFGGADPLRYGPPPGPFTALVHPVPCRPCGDNPCPFDRVCLKAVSVDSAFRAAQRLIQTQRSTSA